jgi:hypothetical protein
MPGFSRGNARGRQVLPALLGGEDYASATTQTVVAADCDEQSSDALKGHATIAQGVALGMIAPLSLKP